MDILEALAQVQPKPEPKNEGNVTDGVFYATLYRLGREDHRDCPVEERSELLAYLERYL